jgi:hypothetical protein
MAGEPARRALQRTDRARAHGDALPPLRWGRQRRLRYRGGAAADIMAAHVRHRGRRGAG